MSGHICGPGNLFLSTKFLSIFIFIYMELTCSPCVCVTSVCPKTCMLGHLAIIGMNFPAGVTRVHDFFNIYENWGAFEA